MSEPVQRRRFLAAVAGAAVTGAAGLSVVARHILSDPTEAASRSGLGDPARPRPARTTPTTGAAATTTTTTAASGAGAVPVLCRDAWGAAPPTGRLPEHRIERLTVHHTAVVLDDNRKAPDRVRGHQRYHQRHGFTDIAYHLVIDANGNVYEGRALDQPGETFTDYEPAGHLLVTLEGNFDQQPLPRPQLEALAEVMAWACHTYDLAPETITGHRDLASTSCPGDAAYRILADGTLAAMVRERLPATRALASVCGSEGSARVAAIRAGEA